MSTIKVTNLQHPSSTDPNMQLTSDGGAIFLGGFNVYADSSARDTAIPSPTAGTVTFQSDTGRLEVYDGSAWKVVGMAEIDPIVATGGDEVYEFVDGGIVYKAHLFENSGNFVVSSAPGGTATAEVLLAAGGGGGAGTGSYYFSGSGGAGGLLIRTVSVTATTYAIVVGSGGAGGASGNNNGTSGQNSTGFSLTAVGGGYGGWASNTNPAGSGETGGAGGSGGGGGGAAAGGAGTAGQGNSGGKGGNISGGQGGGAGGAGAEGYLGTSNVPNGVFTDFWGRPQTICEGGQIGAYAGVITGMTALSYGSGGGGASGNGSAAGGAGQDGIVVVRYPVRYV